MRQHDVKTYLDKHEGKYLLVNSLARRVRELQSGHKALVPRPSGNLIDVASEEFRQDKVEVRTLLEDVDEPKHR